jgi:hypothetical protein
MLYSYAFHLRNNSYHALPLSWPSKPEDRYPDSPNLSAVDHELDEPDLYRHSNASGIVTAPLSGRTRHTPMLSGASFTEFVGAHNSRTSGWPEQLEEVEEVVFDEEEADREAESQTNRVVSTTS